MKRLLKALLASLFLLGALTACQVEKTEEGEVPDVEVQVEGEAELPEYDVDAPEVDVTTEEKKVEVPDVDVDVSTEEETVTVPEVDVTTPTEEGYEDDDSAADAAGDSDDGKTSAEEGGQGR